MNLKSTIKYFIVGGFTFAIPFSYFLWQNGGSEVVGKVKQKPSKEKTIQGYFDWRNEMLKDLSTGQYNPELLKNAYLQTLEIEKSGTRAGEIPLTWQELGPDNVAGRTKAILVDRNNPNRIYCGGCIGGLFISENKGLTWRRSRMVGFEDWNTIGCIAQDAAGKIYIGTGDAGITNPGGGGFGGSYTGTFGGDGTFGNGIYTTTDGDNFTHLTSTTNTGTGAGISNNTWAYVNKIAIDPLNDNRIFAALANGLYVSTNAGATFTPVTGLPTTNTRAIDVEFSATGNNLWASVNNKVLRSKDGGATFQNLEASSLSGYSGSRVEIAVAPSDDNYVYVCFIGNNSLTRAIVKSTNNGDSFLPILFAGSATDPFAQPSGTSGGQGLYDAFIGVNPGDKEIVYVGGVTMYAYSPATSWRRLDVLYTTPGEEAGNSLYIHPDKHTLAFDPSNSDYMYVGTDGGVARSTNARTAFPNLTFKTLNKGLNTWQANHIDAGLRGDVIAGSQDNGTQYINYEYSSIQNATEVLGGDGGAAAISMLNSNVSFKTTYYSQFRRSGTAGEFGGGTFFDRFIDEDGDGEPGRAAADGENVNPFNPKAFLCESKVAFNNVKRAVYKATTNLAAGTKVTFKSNTGGIAFKDSILEVPLAKDSSITTIDPYVSRFFISTGYRANNPFWVCVNPINLSDNARWYRVKEIASSRGVYGSAFASSKDGNIVYIGLTNGKLYKTEGWNTCTYLPDTSVIDGLTVTDLSSKLPGGSTRWISGIAVDQNNPNHVVVTRAQFDGSPSVVRTLDGGATSFTSIQGNLPVLPVYTVVIAEDGNTDKYIIGTELGVWSTQNAGTLWGTNHTEMGKLPVLHMVKKPMHEDGCPVIYAGTHGRGMWRCISLTPTSCKTGLGQFTPGEPKFDFQLYPNPANQFTNIEFSLDHDGEVQYAVMDLTGKVVAQQSVNVENGYNKIHVKTESFTPGMYFIALRSDRKLLGSKSFFVAK